MDFCGCWRIGRQKYKDCRFAIADCQLKTKSAIGNRQSAIYQIPGSAQRKPCEPRQAGNGATVATAACVAGKSGVWPFLFPLRSRAMTKIFVATGFVLSLSLSVLAQTESRADILKKIEAKRAELATLEKQFLSPSEEDRARYAEFLNQPDTGLIRLLPREKFDTATFTENNKSITIRGGGAYYSFARLTHEYGYGSDIELAKGKL